MKKPTLSIIILSHNTKKLLFDCLKSLEQIKSELDFEVIVSENASTDGSLEMVKKDFKWVKLIIGPNISFANGNNRARNIVNAKNVLLLNSDTVVYQNALKKCVEYLENHKDVGALTCKLVLKDGSFDKDSRRRFPRPWISFKRLFLNNGSEYWYEDISSEITHEVDAIQGAFFLTTKQILDKVGWLDEKFVFDGEDLDLSFQIKKLGYKIIYFPEVSIIHIKKASKNNFSGIERKMQGIDSMEYFYRKNLWNNYSIVFNYFIVLGIKILKITRFIQAKLNI